MKTVKLKIGAKGTRPAVVVPTQIAENIDDLTQLARGSTEVIVRWANRGKRIEDQERSGAREAFRTGKSDEEIAALVASYDPTKVVIRERTGTSKPRVKKVQLEAAQAAQLPEKLREQLRAQGVEIVEVGT